MRSLIFIGILVALTGGLVKSLPTGFLPDEDNGYFMVNCQLPDAASLERTDDVLKKVEKIIQASPAVESATTVVGFSLLTGRDGPEHGLRLRQGEAVGGAQGRQGAGRHRHEAPEPRVLQAGARGPGLRLRPAADPGPRERLGLHVHAPGQGRALAAGAPGRWPRSSSPRRRSGPRSGASRTLYRASVPQIFADVDRQKVPDARRLRSATSTARSRALLGSSYLNDFNRFGRVYKVFMQAEPQFRVSPEVARALLREERRTGRWSRSRPS